jgi:hypothetical protein
MSAARKRWAALGLAALAQACVVAPGEVGVVGVAEPGYGAGYYEPPAAVYGGWGVGFDVAPYGRGDREHRPEFRGDRGDRGGRAPAAVGFRPAPAGRPIPTIPTGPRGGAPARGGGAAPHGGGGGGGGGHGGGGRR